MLSSKHFPQTKAHGLLAGLLESSAIRVVLTPTDERLEEKLQLRGHDMGGARGTAADGAGGGSRTAAREG